MIPILFETTETAFTSNGIGRLTEAISCEVEEERNGVYELTLEYPMTGRLYGEISEGRFIYSRHSDALDAQPFRIYKITKPMNGIITVHAHHRSYDLNHVIVRPFTAGSAAEAMQRISLNTLNACPFTFWTDKSVTADFNLKVPASIRSILGGAEGSILDVYGKGEYEWDNATVKLHLNRGTDTGVTVMYGKNLTDIEEESDGGNLVNAVAPYWKNTEGDDVVTLPEGLITISGGVSDNAIPLDLSDRFEEKPTVEELRTRAAAWLNTNRKSEPDSNIKLSFAQLWQTEEYKQYSLLQRVNLCDTVTVIYPALGVKTKTKVIRVVYDALMERYTQMELGEPKTSLSGTLAQQEETVKKIVQSFCYPTVSQVNAAVDTATSLITGGMGGHVVIGTNANGQPNEILIMDTDDIDTAVNVIRMNANGIGFSTTGYNGPFSTAWTIDGAFVADFITSGTLDANLIRAGIIMDKAGKNYWNLETGEISIDASAIGEDYVTSSQLEVTKNGIMTSVSQTYVTKGNAVSSVATQYYSSTSPDSPQGGSWQDTVPDWQDGRYIFEKTVTMTADGQSEEKIVCISGATGATGERGPGIYKVTTEPSSYETETGGFTPAYRIALATVKIQSGVSDVFVGDVIEYDVYHYPVGYVDASYVYLGVRTSIKGENGSPAIAYSLIVSHAAIAKSASGTFSPASITLTAKSQTGTSAPANYSGRFKIEVHNGSSWSTKYTSSSNENTKSYTIPSGTTQVRCSLYLAGGTSTLLDQQTVPVVSDGTSVTITSKSVKYQKGTSGTTAPTGTWSDSIPSNIGENEYLWTQAIVNYSDGNSTEAYSVSRNAADGFSPTVSSTTVEYVESTSGTAHPTSGWSTTPPTTMTAGRYMWTKTTVAYDDGGSSVSYTVSRNGSDGGDAYTIILDNESHTFAGGTSAAIAGTATVNVYAYKGATAIAPTVTKANISGLPTGMTAQSVTNDSSNNKTTIVFAVTTSMTTRSGLVTIPVVADGKTFNKEFSYSLALQGTKGDKGNKGDKGDKGDTGEAGAKGDKGDDGVTYYTYFAYATSSSGANFSKAPTAASTYIGVCITTATTQPTTPASYTWSLTKGNTGSQGPQGPQGEAGAKGDKGEDGITRYTYFAYATSSSGANFSKTPTATSTYIGVCTTTATTQPTTPASYTWSLTKGNTGAKGDKGDKGDKGVGVTSITKTGTSGTVDTYTIKYTDNTSTTFTVTNGTNGTNGTSAEWFYGTALTHTSGTATATISGAKVGDMYLNTATSNVYKCTAKNVWTYAGNIADGVIDNISIGGRNLFKKQPIRYTPAEYLAYMLSLTELLEPDKPYTIQLWDVDVAHSGKTAEQLGIDVYWGGCYLRVAGWQGTNWFTDGHADYLSQTFTVTAAQIERWSTETSNFWFELYNSPPSANGTRSMSIGKWKLEKGNTETDWTPAPEDVDASIATAQTAANTAQATADRKKQTFISTPTTPYCVGDTYFVNGKLLVCHTERLTGSYTADDWSEDLGYASSDTVATLEASTKTELDTIRSEASANYTSLSDSLDKIQASFNTQVEQTSEDFSIRINGLLESLTSLANDTSTKFAEYSKYFRFTADGLEIGEESNALTLVLDNDKISFRRNGVEFSYWDGSDNSFHVGDIIVDVNQVARFGSFGLVPLEGGDLAWKWLGSST